MTNHSTTLTFLQCRPPLNYYLSRKRLCFIFHLFILSFFFVCFLERDIFKFQIHVQVPICHTNLNSITTYIHTHRVFLYEVEPIFNIVNLFVVKISFFKLPPKQFYEKSTKKYQINIRVLEILGYCNIHSYSPNASAH